MTRYTLSLSLSLGGDVPTWEGEATVSYDLWWDGYDYPEIEGICVLKIDGREPEPHEADTIVSIIDGSSRVTDLLIEHAAECDAERHAADLDARDEAKAERVKGE